MFKQDKCEEIAYDDMTVLALGSNFDDYSLLTLYLLSVHDPLLTLSLMSSCYKHLKFGLLARLVIFTDAKILENIA